jgi:hypothetical protein
MPLTSHEAPRSEKVASGTRWGAEEQIGA